MDTQKIDWTQPLEAVHTDGRVKPMILSPEWAGACDFKTTESPDEYNSNSYWHKSGANGFARSPWTIRNANPTRTALEQRMEDLCRKMSGIVVPANTSVSECFAEARAILAELEPVDGDLLIAREIGIAVAGLPELDTNDGGYDSHDAVEAALKGIRRGRALERGESPVTNEGAGR